MNDARESERSDELAGADSFVVVEYADPNDSLPTDVNPPVQSLEQDGYTSPTLPASIQSPECTIEEHLPNPSLLQEDAVVTVSDTYEPRSVFSDETTETYSLDEEEEVANVKEQLAGLKEMLDDYCKAYENTTADNEEDRNELLEKVEQLRAGSAAAKQEVAEFRDQLHQTLEELYKTREDNVRLARDVSGEHVPVAQLVGDLKDGDLIEFEFLQEDLHTKNVRWCVYLGEENGLMYVACKSQVPSTSWTTLNMVESFPTVKCPLVDVALGRKCRIGNYFDRFCDPLEPEDIVQRAVKSIKKKSCFKTCQRLATDCRYGKELVVQDGAASGGSFSIS